MQKPARGRFRGIGVLRYLALRAILRFMSKANDRELVNQLRALELAFEGHDDLALARIGFRVGAYAAFRIAVNLIAARDGVKALRECGRLFESIQLGKEWPPANPPK